MPERKQLPGPSVPIGGYKLIRRFARHKDLSISEAIRQLLKQAPELIEFARQEGSSVGLLDVEAWGGSRDKDDESDEPPMASAAPVPMAEIEASAVTAPAATQTPVATKIAPAKPQIGSRIVQSWSKDDAIRRKK